MFLKSLFLQVFKRRDEECKCVMYNKAACIQSSLQMCTLESGVMVSAEVFKATNCDKCN